MQQLPAAYQKVDKAEDLQNAVPMYNSIQYSENCLRHQVVYGIIAEMSRIILLLIIITMTQ